MDFRPLLKTALRARNELHNVTIGFDSADRPVSFFVDDCETSILMSKREPVHSMALSPDTLRSVKDWALLTRQGEKVSCQGSTYLATSTGNILRPDDEPTAMATIASSELSRLLKEAAYCVPGDDNRYGLNGIHAELAEGILRFVATDGSRLAYAEASVKGSLDISKKTLLPSIKDILPLLEGDIRMGYEEKSLILRSACDGWAIAIAIRLTDGEFPPYRRVLGESIGSIVVNRSAILEACKAVSKTACDKAHTMRMDFPRDGYVYLSSRSIEHGETIAKVAAHHTGSLPGLGGFNVTFWIDTLSAMTCDEIRIAFSDGHWTGDKKDDKGKIIPRCELLSPVYLTPTDGQVPFACIMPTRIEQGTEAKARPEAPEYTGKASKPARKTVKPAIQEAAPVTPAYPDLSPELASVKAERDALRAQVSSHTKESKRQAILLEEASVKMESLRRELTATREELADLRKAPIAIVAPAAQGTPIQAAIVVENVVTSCDIRPASCPEEAIQAYRAARQAIGLNDRSAMARALRLLPEYPAKQALSLRAQLTAALS
jgi:hypothetical protein